MTALIVTGAILSLLLLLLLAPISVVIEAGGDALSLRVKYILLRFDFSPDALARRASAQTSDKKSKRKAAKKAEKQHSKEEKTAAMTVDTIWQIIKSSRHSLGICRRHLVFSDVRIFASIGGGDAHVTAIRLAQVCALVTAALDVIGALFVLETPVVGVAPDFTASATRYSISLRIGIRPLFLLAAAIHFLSRFLKIYMDAKPRKSRKRPRKQHVNV